MTEPPFAGASIPAPPLADDHGATPPDLADALQAAADGRGGGPEVLRALASARLLVPVVAVLEESETGIDGRRRDKQSSMATVLVEAADGRRSLLAFTGVDSLRAWQDDARPVPLAAPLAARAALDEDAAALLVDVAGPVPFAVADGELLLLAAAGRAPGEPSGDPVVRESVRRALAQVPGGREHFRSAHLVPARAREDADQPAAELVLVADEPASRDRLGPVLAGLRSDRVLSAALPGGLHVAVVPPRRAPDTPDLLAPRTARARHHEGHE